MPDNHADEVVIKVRDGGPYKVTGPVRLTDADGRAARRRRTGRSRCVAAGARAPSPTAIARIAPLPGSTLAVHAGLPAPRAG